MLMFSYQMCKLPCLQASFSCSITSGYTKEVVLEVSRISLSRATHGRCFTNESRKKDGPGRNGSTHGCILVTFKCQSLMNRCRAQELCESRGGRPGLPSLMVLMVSVDV